MISKKTKFVSMVTAGLVICALIGTATYDYFRPADDAYFVRLARGLAADCLTKSTCSAVGEGGQISLSSPPLTVYSNCAEPNAFKVLDVHLIPQTGYVRVLLECVDRDAYLFQFASTGKHDGGTYEWLRCSELTCALSRKKLPPVF